MRKANEQAGWEWRLFTIIAYQRERIFLYELDHSPSIQVAFARDLEAQAYFAMWFEKARSSRGFF